MADETQPDLKTASSRMSITTVVPVPKPTTAQVVSSLVQTVLAQSIFGLMWYSGKMSDTVAIPCILALSGIDLLSRQKARVDPQAALALGATGVTQILSKFHILGLLVLGFAASAVGGCGASSADAWRGIDRTLRTVESAYALVCREPEPKVVDECLTARDALTLAQDVAADLRPEPDADAGI